MEQEQQNNVKVWVVRHGANGQLENMSLENNLLILGWHQVPDLTGKNEKEIEETVKQFFKKPHVYSQLTKFVLKLKQNDIVVLPLKTRPGKVAVGLVKGGYKYIEDEENEHPTKHTRKVEWIKTDVQKSAIGEDILKSLYGQLTLFEVKRKNVVERFEHIMKTGTDPALHSAPTQNEEDAIPTQENLISIIGEAEEQILQKIETKFNPHQFAELVGEVLKAEGYAISLPPRAKDGGVDVLVSKGALELESSTCVQVKMTDKPIGPDVLRSLQGTMQSFSADYGLLVSWGGFTRSTEQEAMQHYFKIKLWNAPKFMQHFYRNYNKLPREIKQKIPLKQIWTLIDDVDILD